MRSNSPSHPIAERVVCPEHLDSLPPDDPRAQRSRRDLQRVHRAMRSVSIFVRAIARLALEGPPRRILELGAGDGTLLLRLLTALRTQWPGGDVVLLDQHDLVSAATRARFAAIGWNVIVLPVDVLEWVRVPHREHYDLSLTSLFLHHFATRELMALLTAIAARTDAFVACEPRRNAFSRFGSQLIVLLGANAVTRQDGVTSVEAGFAARELSALWPSSPGTWRLEEYLAYPFTHCFSARRLEVPRPPPDERP